MKKLAMKCPRLREVQIAGPRGFKSSEYYLEFTIVRHQRARRRVRQQEGSVGVSSDEAELAFELAEEVTVWVDVG